ncbi:MAG: hypothetical protein RLY67_607, partial [Pseudomonadota bacterium]
MSMHEVKVPQLSESVSEATLLQWKKKLGEAVKVDEILIEIETDKVVLEVPAPSAGVIAEIVKTDGASVTSGEVIATIDSEGKASASPPATASSAASAPTPAPAATATSAISKAAGSAGVAMPAAAKLMAETGVTPSAG